MSQPNDSRLVISLGGSLIVPRGADFKFLKKFVAFILGQTRAFKKFHIVCGGGKLARKFIQTAKKSGKFKPADLDWLGILATRINAELLRREFEKYAHKEVLSDPTVRLVSKKPIRVYSGWIPGRSTDYDAVRIAQTYGIETVINLSNIDYVYSADPKIHKNAKKITNLTWREFRRHFGSRWTPGANLPFDPVAAKLAQKLGVRVVILNGRKFQNLADFFDGRKFRGTVIA